ncbi:MAG TPA: hypothetical protein VMV53_09015 [Acidimicrobiales bacterium]|nr:hypothetical protein [Acidimicrobiales bacterium]
MRNGIELSISCSDCVRRATPDCEDCLVSFVLDGPPEALEMTSSDAEVVELFAAERLIPRLRYRTASASASASASGDGSSAY